MARPSYPIAYPTEPELDREPLLSGREKRNLAIGGAAVGIPGYLYAKGVHAGGVPWRQVPGAAWGQIKGRKSYDIASALRTGAISTGKDIGSIGPRIWRHVKGIGKGLAGKALSSDAKLVQLSAKLDDLIQFQDPEDFDYAYNHPTIKKRVKQLWKSGKLAKGRYDHPEIQGMAMSLAWQHYNRDPVRRPQLSAKLDDLINFVVRLTPEEYEELTGRGKSSFPKAAALIGGGALTGAGIATGSLATRSLLMRSGKRLQRWVKRVGKKI